MQSEKVPSGANPVPVRIYGWTILNAELIKKSGLKTVKYLNFAKVGLYYNLLNWNFIKIFNFKYVRTGVKRPFQDSKEMRKWQYRREKLPRWRSAAAKLLTVTKAFRLLFARTAAQLLPRIAPAWSAALTKVRVWLTPPSKRFQSLKLTGIAWIFHNGRNSRRRKIQAFCV